MIRALILMLAMALPASARPPTGLLEKPSPLPATIPLQVTAPEGRDHAILLSDADGGKVISAYLRGGEVLRLLVPPGNHRLSVASGRPEDWRGRGALFGEDAVAVPGTLPFRIDGARREGQTITLTEEDGALRIADRRNRVICQIAEWEVERVEETAPGGTTLRYLDPVLRTRSRLCD